MTLLANTAKDYVLEASARAELLDHPSAYPELGLQLSTAAGGAGQGNGNGMSRQESSQNLPLMLVSKGVRYEMPVLCRKFLGPWGRLAYMLCLSIYIYGALLAYTSVFAKSCASTFPIPGVNDSYAVYLALFALIVVPLSCLELTEQVAIQVVLAGCRILLVVLMVGTVGAAYGSKAEAFPGQSGEKRESNFPHLPTPTQTRLSHPPHPTPPHPTQNTKTKTGPVGIPLWDVGGLYVFLPIACYAFIYHHSIAGLSHPVRDKTLLGSIFLTTFLICAVAYGAIAVLVASYFGPDMAQSSNLEWQDYGAGKGSGFERALAFYILLFPALDVASAFPLNAITLGNNMIAMRDKTKPSLGGGARPAAGGRRLVVAFRLLAAVPPIIAGFFVRELGKISEWCGTVGIIITLVFPAILNLKSRQVLKEVFALESAKTYYSNELSRKRYGPVNLLVGVALFVYIMVNLVMGKE